MKISLLTELNIFKQLLAKINFDSTYLNEETTEKITSSTKNIMSEARISKMKKGAVLINYSRGDVLDIKAAKKAIESKQLPPLENAEKQIQITSLFEEKDESKKQVYYQHQSELENKLKKVIQTKTIQEIQVNHLEIAKQIKETIEPQKIQGKE